MKVFKPRRGVRVQKRLDHGGREREIGFQHRNVEAIARQGNQVPGHGRHPGIAAAMRHIIWSSFRVTSEPGPPVLVSAAIT